jgi:hypothetical protein
LIHVDEYVSKPLRNGLSVLPQRALSRALKIRAG